MAKSSIRAGIDTGPNSRPLNYTIAQSGPGIPDDAASEGYDPIAEAEIEHDLEAGGIDADTVFKQADR